MSNVIDFSELIPERLRVNGLPDGSSLELMHMNELGPDRLILLQPFIREFEVFQDKKSDPAKSGPRLRAAVEGILREVAVGMSDATLAGLTDGQRWNIVRWWFEQVTAGKNGSTPKADAQP